MDRPFSDFRPFGPIVEYSQPEEDEELVFLGDEREVGPLVLLRQFKSGVESDLENQKIMTDFGSLEWDEMNMVTENISVTWGFNEAHVDEEFTFEPLGGGSQGSPVDGGTTLQGTPAEELGGKAGEFASMFKQVFDTSFEWEFAELNAASLGHTHFTDYEFEYEITVSKNEVVNTDPGEEL